MERTQAAAALRTVSARCCCLDVPCFPIDKNWYFARRAGKQLSPVACACLDLARAPAKGLVLESLATH